MSDRPPSVLRQFVLLQPKVGTAPTDDEWDEAERVIREWYAEKGYAPEAITLERRVDELNERCSVYGETVERFKP